MRRPLLCPMLCGLVFVASSAHQCAFAQATSIGVTSTQVTRTQTAAAPSGQQSASVLVEVFANSDTFITGTGGDGRYIVQVLRVDAIRMLELELERDLPPNEAVALTIVRARIKAMGASFAQRSRHGGQAVMGSRSYGLRGYPAMVFGGKAVVYGLTDVPTATRVFEAGRAQPITRGRINPTKLEAMGIRR